MDVPNYFIQEKKICFLASFTEIVGDVWLYRRTAYLCNASMSYSEISVRILERWQNTLFVVGRDLQTSHAVIFLIPLKMKLYHIQKIHA